eukprot:CAMPEP_0204386974 /NCGR_PEP_ID=MMETSP0469-20131031/58681_1 /ASSEMBLY_ACC=CAM_ASM_000384 /TAXON_ID=2969 /ORGANISM="Oxyrrhis marina" /LENGTH=82 /DNA_ID=CAMNT_0051380277 /DNA_START=49 /DNA_END=294 /DNA_ORIENTATION=-
MKVKVKTIKNEQWELEVEPTTQVSDVKQKIAESRPDFPADAQRLICAGKVLEDAKTLGDYAVKEGDFLVVMATKKPAAAAAA